MRSQRAHEEAVAACVVDSLEEVSGYEMREAPDVDLQHVGGHHIGLEVTSTVDQAHYDTKRRLESAIREVQEELNTREAPLSLTVYFDREALRPRRDGRAHRIWLRLMTKELADLVLRGESSGTFEHEALRSHGIDRIARIEWRPSKKPQAVLGWRTRTRRGNSLVEKLLAKKHDRLKSYKAGDHHFREFWLAIDGIAPGTIADGGYQMLLERSYSTSFDRVLLIRHGSQGRFQKALDVTPGRSS